MPAMFESKKPPTAEEIGKMADRGEDGSRFFTRKGRMMPPTLAIQRVNVDFALPMLEDLDKQSVTHDPKLETIINRPVLSINNE